MERPYIICHMVTSVDGKVTGDFLFRKECAPITSVYYEINRELKCDGFICGRVTMKESFTGGWYPDLSEYAGASFAREDYTDVEHSGFFAIAFDSHGKLGWKTGCIVDPDGDPGYDGAQIVEVLSEDVDDRYLAYLRAVGIPYIFAGESSIDVSVALSKLRELLGCESLLLEGGSIINGAFEKADAIDELSLVVAPVIAGASSAPLFADAAISDYSLISSIHRENALILRYKRVR